MTDPLDFDGLVIAICQAGQANGFYLSENEARAILAAVLPHVLSGPREALRPFAQVSIFFSERYLPSDAVADLSRRGEYARIEVGDLRRAEAELARIDKMTEGK